MAVIVEKETYWCHTLQKWSLAIAPVHVLAAQPTWDLQGLQ